MSATTRADFIGPWIGETIGYDSPAHIWEIRVRASRLEIRTRWEGEAGWEVMYAEVTTDPAGFAIGERRAVLVDAQHFVIPGWDTNDTRGGIGPAYDVVFSRPGIAELSAHHAYRRFIASQDHD